jgi:hypothetical protein
MAMPITATPSPPPQTTTTTTTTTTSSSRDAGRVHLVRLQRRTSWASICPRLSHESRTRSVANGVFSWRCPSGFMLATTTRTLHMIVVQTRFVAFTNHSEPALARTLLHRRNARGLLLSAAPGCSWDVVSLALTLYLEMEFCLIGVACAGGPGAEQSRSEYRVRPDAHHSSENPCPATLGRGQAQGALARLWASWAAAVHDVGWCADW